MSINTPLQIAIDGPVAAGKGDIASRLSKELHLSYINTGAMYRMLALACIEQNVPRKDETHVLEVLHKIHMDLQPPDKNSEQTYKGLLDGKEVTDRLLDPDVAQGSSDVAVLSLIRKEMVELQKHMAVGRRVVMEGRDIGLRVLPNAQVKIYLTASLEERARRRCEQWKQKGIDKTLAEVMKETEERDTQDMSRATDPLQKLPDAWELDTTQMTQEEVITKIIQKLKERNLV